MDFPESIQLPVSDRKKQHIQGGLKKGLGNRYLLLMSANGMGKAGGRV